MMWLSSGYLFALRQSIIFWTQLYVWPLEFAFERIEDELEARGHRVREDD